MIALSLAVNHNAFATKFSSVTSPGTQTLEQICAQEVYWGVFWDRPQQSAREVEKGTEMRCIKARPKGDSLVPPWGKGVKPLYPASVSLWLETGPREGRFLGKGLSISGE